MNHLGKFSRGPYEEHLDEIIWNLAPQFRSRLKFFSSFSSGGHFLHRSGTFGHFGEDLMRNICDFGPVVREKI